MHLKLLRKQALRQRLCLKLLRKFFEEYVEERVLFFECPSTAAAVELSEVVQKVVSVPERELDLTTLLRFWDLARVRHLWTRHVLQFLPST